MEYSARGQLNSFVRTVRESEPDTFHPTAMLKPDRKFPRIKCPNCGHPNLDRNRVCFVCSAVLPQRLTCKHRPRITKINGEWRVYDGLDMSLMTKLTDHATLTTWNEAIEYAGLCVMNHHHYMTEECK